MAKQLEGVEVEHKRELYDRISESHHSYPCTASMERDKELGDPVLHKAGYLIREAVEDTTNIEDFVMPVKIPDAVEAALTADKIISL